MSAPCYRCGDRQIGCHSKCGRYKEYREEFVQRSKKNDVDRACKDIVYNGVKASKRDARNGHDVKNVRNYRG